MSTTHAHAVTPSKGERGGKLYMGGVVVVIVTNIMEEALTPVDRQELHIVGHLRSLDYHKAIYVAKVSYY